ncbi:MAG: hypothetical protein DWI59_01080 [Chloroflexi bacterium]|nr:MAG: hypothetical protein DWI59_01080 [Chloroflexota bacterium]
MAAGDRCEFCTTRPREEVAVARWHAPDPDDRERLTLWLCSRHMERMSKAGTRGWPHEGWLHKIGWW